MQNTRWLTSFIAASAIVTASACQLIDDQAPGTNPVSPASVPISQEPPAARGPADPAANPVPTTPAPAAPAIPNTPAPVTPVGSAALDELIADMTGSHEALMHGVPEYYSWALTPDAGEDANDPAGFKAMTAWGLVYEVADGNPSANSRVQITDEQSWLLDKSGNWSQIQSTESVEGSFFTEDFGGNSTTDRDVRTEPSGGVSVVPGGGYNYHFWPTGGRATIDPNDVSGLVTTFQARTVLNDPNGPDDRAEARFVAGSGADWWLDLHATWDNFKTNRGLGQGKVKLVKPEWRTFAFHTLTEEQLRSNPPPFVGDAKSPANQAPAAEVTSFAAPAAPIPDATPATKPESVSVAGTLPATGAIRIMTLGDSITEGNGTDGDQSYRGHLFNKLVASGLEVDFVGTQSKPTAAGGDPDHEGHGGFVIGPGPSAADAWAPGGRGNLYDNLETYLAADPDVVFVLAGINDYFNIVDQPDYDPNVDGADRLVALAKRIRELNPDTLVVLSTLLPVEFSDDYTAGFNEELTALVESLDGIAVVDSNSAPITADGFLDGGLHLNDTGAEVAAETIAQQLLPIIHAWREPAA